MAMTLAEIGPYLALILVGFLPNEVWRVLGLVAVRGLNEDSQIIVWVRAVATAILAGVLAQLVMTTSGALATIPLFVRIGALVLGFVAFLLVRRSVFVGVLVGELAFLAGAWMYGPG
jgi:Branched-chain amino acid transport protein (AzlD)